MNLAELDSPCSTSYSPHPHGIHPSSSRPAPPRVPISESFGCGSFHHSPSEGVADVGLRGSVKAAQNRWKEWGWDFWDLGWVSLAKLTHFVSTPNPPSVDCWEDGLKSTRTFGEGYADSSYHEASSFKLSSSCFLHKTVADRMLPQPPSHPR